MDWVILAGNIGHEASWPGGLPRPLLPLPGTTMIEALLTSFRHTSGGTCTICANGRTELVGQYLQRSAFDTADIGFFEDPMPRGSAGCLKGCESRLTGGTVLVLGGSVWLEDDPEWMLRQHRSEGNALTVFCSGSDRAPPRSTRGTLLKPAGVYCCEPIVLDFIRSTGYQDLKEQLVPALRRAGLRVGAVTLKMPTCQVSDWRGYVHALHRALSTGRLEEKGYNEAAPGIWFGEDVEIAPTARIVGPVLLGNRCRISDGAVIIGPTMLGDECEIGNGSWLVRVVAPKRTRCPAGMSVTDQFLADEELIPRTAPSTGTVADSKSPDATPEGEDATAVDSSGTLASGVATAAALAAVFIWAFWDSASDLWSTWQGNADYSAGQLVPLAALYMLFIRREVLKKLSLNPTSVGLLIFSAGLFINLLGGYYLYASLENVGMLICAHGMVLGLLGWSGYRRIWYPMAFLVLMLPIPNSIHNAIMLPLQSVGAQISEYALEVIGVPAVRYGHVLEVNGHRIAVAEACSGLRMALAFLIVTGVFAYIIRRPRWQKVIVLLSSIPIAIACNVLRIVAAAYLYTIGYGWLARGAFHDMAGLFMIPIAMSLVLLELWLLSNLIVPRGSVAALVDRVGRAKLVTVER